MFTNYLILLRIIRAWLDQISVNSLLIFPTYVCMFLNFFPAYFTYVLRNAKPYHKYGSRSFCTIDSLFIFDPFWIQTTFDRSIVSDNNETDDNEDVGVSMVT